MMRPTRPAGWDFRLIAEFDAASRRRWEWGSHDCASFAAGCVRAVLGDHGRFAPGLAVAWSSRREAEAIIRAGGCLIDIIDGLAPRIDPRRAMRGDLAAVSGPRGPALAVVDGARVRVAAAQGLAVLPLSSVVAAWPVDPVEAL